MRSVRVLVVGAAAAIAHDAAAVCPHLHADDAAYARSTIAFVGEVIGDGAAPASPGDAVPAGATLASACPVQAQWSPPAGKACVIGVVTDRGARVALDQAHAVTVDGAPAETTADGCFGWCGDPGAHAVVYVDTQLRGSKPLDGSSFDVTLRAQSRALPRARVRDGERRFVRVDLHDLPARTRTRHDQWSTWQLDAWNQGGVAPNSLQMTMVRVDVAWKGTCPHRQILIDTSGPAACRPILVAGGPASHVVVFATVDEHGLAEVEGLDAVRRGTDLAQLRPAGAVDLACQ